MAGRGVKILKIHPHTQKFDAADPRVLLADIVSASPDAITVRDLSGQERTFTVDDDTFIRIEHPGVRQKRADYVPSAPAGKRIVVVFDGDHAETLRRASDN